MESVAARLGEYHAKEKEATMLSGEYLTMPEHIKVGQTSLYLEGCDYKKCLGYQLIALPNHDLKVQPKFFQVEEINFMNPEVIED